jgi:4-phytase/acid phosphatase
LGAGCQVQARHGPLGESDALFDSLSAGVCALDPSTAAQAVKIEAGAGGLVSPDSAAALHALQAVAAPEGCQGQGQDKGGKGGEGVCLAGETTLGASPTGVKLVGPLAVGATLAENLFLEEAEGFPPAQVGWGRLSANGGLETVMAAHERMSDLTRRTPYIAQRRGVTLARAILKALDPSSPSDPHAPPSPQGAKVIAFVGHDTNLANMAGVFGLRWTLPDQPDATAPATVLAFELWREGTSDRRVVRTVIYYETLSQLRTLKPQSISSVPLSFAGCAEGVAGVCPLPRLTAQVGKALADACPAH